MLQRAKYQRSAHVGNMEAHVEEHILRASSHGFELLPTRGANPSALDTPPAEKALISTLLIGNSKSQRPSYTCLYLFPPQSPLA